MVSPGRTSTSVLGGGIFLSVRVLVGHRLTAWFAIWSRNISCRASAYQPGPAEELKMILPRTAEMASL